MPPNRMRRPLGVLKNFTMSRIGLPSGDIISILRAYAALSTLRSSASSKATRSDTSHSRSVTPAAIAGVQRSVEWILMKLYAKYPSATAAA